MLARFEQIANYAMMRIADLGMEADKAMTNEEADAFLEDPKTTTLPPPWAMCLSTARPTRATSSK